MSFRNEDKILLHCLKNRFDNEAVSELIKAQLDWHYILETGKKNGVCSLMYHSLRKMEKQGLVPSEIRQYLQRKYHAIGYRNSCLYQELTRVLTCFGNLGIRVIVLKGGAIAETIWGNAALREMFDIDLLVREEDLDKAQETLFELGYITIERKHSKDWYRRNHHHLAPLYNPEKRIAIEVHRDLLPPNKYPFRIGTCKIWERTETLRIEGIKAEILCPEDQIMHLCVHLSQHLNERSGRMRDLADICQVVKYYGEKIEWDLLIKESSEGNFSNRLYYPLFFAREFLGLQIDEGILQKLRRKSSITSPEDRVLKQLFKSVIFLKYRGPSFVPENVTVVARSCLLIIYFNLLQERSMLIKITFILRGVLLKIFLGPIGDLDSKPSLDKSAFRHGVISVASKRIAKFGRIIFRISFRKTRAFFPNSSPLR